MRTSRPGSFQTRFTLVCLLGFALLNAGILWQMRGPVFQGYSDFASFYTAGQIVRSGLSPRLYDRNLQWNVQQQFASSVKIRRGPLPYIRPPFEALLFLPFAYLTYPAACVAWLTLNLALLLAVPLLLPHSSRDGPSRSSYLRQSLMCLAFFPAAFDMIQGQDAILFLLILLCGLRLLRRGVDFACGAVLALGLFKFHFVIPLLAILLLRKKGRVVLGFLAMGLLLFGVSLVMVRWSGLLAYPGYLWSLNGQPGLGMVSFPRGMPNLRGLWAILSGNGHLPPVAHGLLVAIVGFGIVVASRLFRGNDRRSIAAAFCSWIAVTLAASYYSNAYDLTVLLLPLLLLGNIFSGSGISGWRRITFLVAAGILLCTPLQWLLLRAGDFGWMSLVLLAFAGSISGPATWQTE